MPPPDGRTGTETAEGPEPAQALHDRALAAHQAGRLDEAEALYRAILAADPDRLPTRLNLGALLAGRDAPRAEAEFRLVLAHDPAHADAWSNLAVVLKRLGRLDEAEAAWRQALTHAPHHADAGFNLGRHLTATGRPTEALPLLDASVLARPADPARWVALGSARLRAGDPWGAAAEFRRALERSTPGPETAETWSSLGAALQAAGQWQEAQAAFDRAHALDPGNGDIRYNRALGQLLLGLPGAWAEHERRWSAPGFTSPKRSFAAPLWDGSPDPEMTLLLHAEQGLGDTLQFIRYLPAARARVGRVVFEGQAPLLPLLAPFDAETVAQGTALPPFARHAPLLSLPALLGPQLGVPAPYLVAAPERMARLAPVLAPLARPIVGLAWAGNPAHGNDRNRSLPFGRLVPLLALRGLAFASLQKGERAADPARLGYGLVELGAMLGDLADAAAALVQLDLLVTVDTALAHLAGALGVRALVLLPFNPDWRWGVTGETTPWYPSFRLLRQARPGDWSGPIASAEDALAQLARPVAGAA